MKKILARILIGIGCVLALLIILIVAALTPRFANMKSEYVTVGARCPVRAFGWRTC